MSDSGSAVGVFHDAERAYPGALVLFGVGIVHSSGLNMYCVCVLCSYVINLCNRRVYVCLCLINLFTAVFTYLCLLCVFLVLVQ